jgi:hypothetical protein
MPLHQTKNDLVGVSATGAETLRIQEDGTIVGSSATISGAVTVTGAATVGELDVNGHADIDFASVGGGTGGALVLEKTALVGGGAQTPSSLVTLQGFLYNGAAGGAVNLTLPDVTDIVTVAGVLGHTPLAPGSTLGDSLINVTDANNLTIVAGVGGTVVGNAVVNNGTVILRTVITQVNPAQTALHMVIAPAP